MISRAFIGVSLALALFPAALLAQSGSWADQLSSALPRTSPPAFGPTPGGTSTSSFGVPVNIPGVFNNVPDWKLGISIQNSAEGAIVTSVANGSAAQQAAINIGDTIVAAGPVRLGLIDGRVVEIAEEIKRFADSYGRITLLVFDGRTRSLRSVSVNMTSNASRLSGAISLADNAQLPTGAALVVQLKNITNPNYDVAGGTTSRWIQGYGPFEFELNVDPRYISPSDQYQLTASIYVNQQLAYQLNPPINVSATTLGQRYNLLMLRVGTGSSVSAAYPNFNNSADVITKTFLQYLGRAPMTSEMIAWQDSFNRGNNLDSLRVGILSGTKYREVFQGDEAAYLQSVVKALTNRQPSQQELSFWLGRLQATGSPETVAREILAR